MAYIERETALKIIDNYANTVTEDGKVIVDAIRDIIAVITPTADVVEVKHGHWTEKQIPLDWCDDDVDIVYECSICKAEEPYKSPRCPECGAKMDIEKE